MASIRDLDPERDAEGVVELLREVNPSMVVSPASWLHRVRTIPERAEQAGWVAVSEGRIVGNGWSCRTFFSAESTSAIGNVMVAVSHRRQGIGAELYDLAAAHVDSLRCTEFLVSARDSPEGNTFASARGFREIRAETESVLDLRAGHEAPPAGVDLRPLTDVDPRLAYEVDLAATRDMPSTEPIDDIPYDEWVDHVLEYPLFTRDGSFVAFVDGVGAAVSLLIADESSGRSMNMFTGTLREYRGRGLGIAVKLASIAWAREHGITQMATRNDETNAPMLAINRKLGFVPAGRLVEFVRR